MSMSFNIALFFHKLYTKLFHTLETFYLSSALFLKTLASNHREPMQLRV